MQHAPPSPSFSAEKGSKRAQQDIDKVINQVRIYNGRRKSAPTPQPCATSLVGKKSIKTITSHNQKIRTVVRKLQDIIDNDDKVKNTLEYFIAGRKQVEAEVGNVKMDVHELARKLSQNNGADVSARLDELEELLVHLQSMDVPGATECIMLIMEIDATITFTMTDLMEVCDELVRLRGMSTAGMGPRVDYEPPTSESEIHRGDDARGTFTTTTRRQTPRRGLLGPFRGATLRSHPEPAFGLGKRKKREEQEDEDMVDIDEVIPKRPALRKGKPEGRVLGGKGKQSWDHHKGKAKHVSGNTKMSDDISSRLEMRAAFGASAELRAAEVPAGRTVKLLGWYDTIDDEDDYLATSDGTNIQPIASPPGTTEDTLRVNGSLSAAAADESSAEESSPRKQSRSFSDDAYTSGLDEYENSMGDLEQQMESDGVSGMDENLDGKEQAQSGYENDISDMEL